MAPVLASHPAPSSPHLAYAFRVTGLVQGVGFRWATQEEAKRWKLVGWVRNNDDGSVSGVVQGPAEALASFRSWLGQGPRSARVQSVEWSEAPLEGFRLFTVR